MAFICSLARKTKFPEVIQVVRLRRNRIKNPARKWEIMIRKNTKRRKRRSTKMNQRTTNNMADLLLIFSTSSRVICIVYMRCNYSYILYNKLIKLGQFEYFICIVIFETRAGVLISHSWKYYLTFIKK